MQNLKLSIITINYNNAEGLRKTLASVASQTYQDIEHIIVDGGSIDGSVEVIKEYVRNVERKNELTNEGIHVVWLSEPDKGIYNAMNKGIEIALGRRIVNSFNRSELVEDKNKGIEIAHGRRVVNALNRSEQREDKNKVLPDYYQFLNSGDTLAAPDVTERMMTEMDAVNTKCLSRNENTIDILYGDMLKIGVKNRAHTDHSGGDDGVTLNMFYRGCLNHSPAYIKRSLFEEYGLYDETLKICSDWKFYMQSIVLGKATTKHVPIIVTHFDMNGISETRKDILNEERNRLLKELIPRGILADYDRYHFPMSQYDRLKRHHLWGIVWFIERVLFKLEKWGILK